MSRSSLMTALALLLATTTASAAKTPARVVVHEGDSIQAAIDAASPGTTIVVKPGVYRGDRCHAGPSPSPRTAFTSSARHAQSARDPPADRARRRTASGCRQPTRRIRPTPSYRRAGC